MSFGPGARNLSKTTASNTWKAEQCNEACVFLGAEVQKVR